MLDIMIIKNTTIIKHIVDPIAYLILPLLS